MGPQEKHVSSEVWFAPPETRTRNGSSGLTLRTQRETVGVCWKVCVAPGGVMWGLQCEELVALRVRVGCSGSSPASPCLPFSSEASLKLDGAILSACVCVCVSVLARPSPAPLRGLLRASVELGAAVFALSHATAFLGKRERDRAQCGADHWEVTLFLLGTRSFGEALRVHLFFLSCCRKDLKHPQRSLKSSFVFHG